MAGQARNDNQRPRQAAALKARLDFVTDEVINIVREGIGQPDAIADHLGGAALKVLTVVGRMPVATAEAQLIESIGRRRADGERIVAIPLFYSVERPREPLLGAPVLKPLRGIQS